MLLSILYKNVISKFVKQEEAVTAIEYALIASLIAVVIVGTVRILGTTLSGVFTTITNAI